MRSRLVRVRSGLELLLAPFTAGVCDRGVMVREEAVSALPRVWLGSREADEGFSIWCDTFPAAGRACKRGRAAASRAHTQGSAQNCSSAAGNFRRSHKAHYGTAEGRHRRAPSRVGSVFHGTSHGLGDDYGLTGEKLLTHAAGFSCSIFRVRRRILQPV